MTGTRTSMSIRTRRVSTARTAGIMTLVAGGALLFGVGCGGSGSSSSTQTTTTPPPTTSSANVLAISVDAGPDTAEPYANGAFASVIVCTPGTTTCQTIDGVLVDTGSSGLRLLSSVLTISLPQQTANGNPVAECLPFVSGYTWGPVQTADVELSGETANAVPIQVINGSAFTVPSACSNQGTAENTLADLGANGILGVGNFVQDCGDACVSTGASNPALYYQCVSSNCTVIGEPLAQQVANPVASFAKDNNGVIIELPAVSAPEATLNGSLIFGIGTESNNALNGATVYPVDDFGNFITIFKTSSTTITNTTSFIDSGSNGLYFFDSAQTGIPTCRDANFFYCPSSTENLSATTEGAGGTPSSTINFSVANADALFNDNPTANVFEDLAGPNSISGFDWGLPFFYGRNVYTAIQGQTTPGGTGPYWAY
jgi:hypothetical protein